MPTLSNVHTERVFENELCELLPANGGFVRTHLQDAKFYSRVAGPLFQRPACIFPGYPLKEPAQARSKTEQQFGMSDFKAVPPAWRTVIPEYVKDYVPLNQFM